MKPILPVAVGLLLAAVASAQPPTPVGPAPVMPAKVADPNPVALTLEDQFDRPTDLAAYRGCVVILVYGDRKGTEACQKLGEQLHVCWHPDAKGQPPAKAQAAPVVALEGLRPGQPSPDVRVIPVACCGKVPGPIKSTIKTQMAKGSPDVAVWLDFGDTMKGTFGLTAGEPNVVIFDTAGRLRMKINGTPDQPTLDRLVKSVQGLRSEAVK